MKLNDIILEGRDAELYHYTTLDILYNIIYSDRINGTTKQYINNKLVKGVSLTRDQFFKFADTGKVLGARIMLDQRRLTHNHKIIPVDFFQTSKEDSKEFTNKEMNLTSSRDRGLTESEEFLVGNLDKVTKYTVEVGLRATPDAHLLELLEQEGVKITFYSKNWRKL